MLDQLFTNELPPKLQPRLERIFRRMFGCDAVRFSVSGGICFLMLGQKRNTAKDRLERPDAGHILVNGVPHDFDYIHYDVVASGDTLRHLLRSAREYRRVSRMTMEQFLEERFGVRAQDPVALIEHAHLLKQGHVG